jgi:toxin FitB
MTILDTNVISALMRETPDPSVISWLDRQPVSSIWTTSITILEIHFGLEILPNGKRKTALVHAFELMLDKIGGRVAAFDSFAARQAADLMAGRQKKGRPGDLRDTMIAGIVLANHATLATRNSSHFSDISATIVNPWD